MIEHGVSLMPDDATAWTLTNAVVFTADRAHPWAEAVGVYGDRIAAVGTSAEVRAVMPRAAEIDCRGRLVTAGFIDAHNHFLATGEMFGHLVVRYPEIASVEDLVRAVGEAVAGARPGEFVRATGFDHNKYASAPTRWDLDAVSPANPVVLLHVSGHYTLVNSLALQLAGLDESAPDPEGGRFVRDGNGRLTGLCLDAATGLIQPSWVDIGHHGPNFHTQVPLAELIAAVERASTAYLAAGLTTVCDAQVTSRELQAYRAGRDSGALRIRTVCMPLSSQLDEYAALGLAGPFGDDRLCIGAMKFYCDGSLIGGTAAFTEPPPASCSHSGSVYWDGEAFRAAIIRAHCAGWQIGVHAQGDYAIGMTLDAFEAAHERQPRPDARFRIEHCGYPTHQQIARMRDLGVLAVTQPSYLRDSGDDFLTIYPEKAHDLQPAGALRAAGVRVVLSSDSDVASYRPLDTIAAAMERRTLGGRLIGAAHAMTFEEALHAHTAEAAYALRIEDRFGTLRPGKLADLTVTDIVGRDPAADQVREADTWLTAVGGQIVHQLDTL